MMQNGEQIVLQSIQPLINNEEVLNIYLFGSRVYGYHTEQSDYDFIVVVQNDTKHFPNSSDHLTTLLDDLNIDNRSEWSFHEGQFMFRSSACDCTIYTEEFFERMVNQFEISYVECVSMQFCDHKEEYVLLQRRSFQIPAIVTKEEKLRLRKAISEEQNHSFIKARNKLRKECDEDAAKRALFHSIRTLLFGLQIVKHGYITDFAACNDLYYQIVRDNQNSDEITSADELWNRKYKTPYQPMIKKMLSELRILCPK